MRLAIALLLCSCDRREPVASCTDDLAGVYEVETTATEEHPTRWNILDNRRGLEAYPMFDDVAQGSGESAPRVIDLRRTGDALVGEVTRRFMQGPLRCDAKATARVTACKDDMLEIVLADPQPPLTFDPCAYGQSASSRRERWRRVK
ncbi:MAG: hypothetical protein M4D80_02785 [Myxococcota bacterium]|nr:hypothetical protein [Myxococcota bacterium]